MDEPYLRSRFLQLQNAHKTHVVVMSRNRELARKLRPEFGKVVFFEEARKCLAYIAAANHNPELPGGVDAALVDYENVKALEPLKVLEYINKRVTDSATAKLPLIVSVTLLSTCDADSERALEENVQLAGGSNFIVKNPTTRAVLYALIEGIYNKKHVESTYRDLRHKQAKFKYPYFPSFKDVKVKKMKKLRNDYDDDDDDDDNDEDEEDFDCQAHRRTSVNIRPSLQRSMSKVRGSSATISTLDKALRSISASPGSRARDDDSNGSDVDELSDWTDAASLLPPFLSEVRDGELEAAAKGAERDEEALRLRHLATDAVVGKMQEGEMRSAEDDGKAEPVRRQGTRQLTNADLAADKSADTGVLVRVLLDPDNRPKWGVGHNAASTDLRSTSPLAAAPEDSAGRMRVFYDRPRPDIALEHTIGGLDKRSAQQCWQVMQARAAQGGGRAGRVATADLDSVDVQESLQGSRPPTVGGDNRRSQIGQTSLKLSIKAVEKAERALRRMAREAPPDLQTDKIKEMDFSRRHHYCGERDMYDQGLRYERSGDVDEATTFYSRAGMHSKDPHLSKIFLGVLAYKQRQFMTALTLFTSAIMIQESAPPSAYIVYDDFLAHFNRGVVRLRLGDDQGGVADVKKACELDPKDLEAAEMYALALRRLRQYHGSIELIKDNKRVRMLLDSERALASEEAALVKQRKKAKDAEMKRQMGRMSVFGGRQSLIHGKRLVPSVNLQAVNKHEVLQVLHEHIKIAHPTYHTGRHGSIGSGGHTSRNSHFRKSAFIMKSTSELGERAFFGHKVRIDENVDCGLRSQAMRALAQTGRAPGAVESEGAANEGEGSSALEAFRASVGLGGDLFESICVKPSPLQVALACSPYMRKQHHIDIISTALRLIPFLMRFPPSTITKLATVVEYRAIAQPGKLFQQDVAPDAVLFLLSGSVRVMLETGDMSPNVHIGDCQPLDAIAHKDMLFNYDDSLYVSELRRMCEKELQDAKRREDGREGDEAEEEEEEEEEQAAEHSIYRRHFRATEPGLFSVYESTGVAEVILFEQEMFNYALRSQAEDEIARIIEGIASCGCFRSMPLHDRLRLARMGVLRTYKAGHVFTEQAEAVDFLCIVMKGTCKAYKRPNLSEIYARILAGLRQKALAHDTTFSFHHKLRDSLIKPAEAADPAQLEAVAARLGTQKDSVTGTELSRHVLGLEISKYDALLKKSMAQEIQDELERDSLETVDPADLMCEIAVLNWPMIFGEACVVDFEGCLSRATITADTTVDVFLLHKNQLATFAIDEAFQKDVASKAIRYPEDKELVSKLESEKAWTHYKAGVLEGIPKKRWIKPISEQTVHFI